MSGRFLCHNLGGGVGIFEQRVDGERCAFRAKWGTQYPCFFFEGIHPAVLQSV
jgi:hypothetical protein